VIRYVAMAAAAAVFLLVLACAFGYLDFWIGKVFG
jgi:hypothetical protein